MKRKDKSKKIFSIVEITVLGIFLLALIGCFVLQLAFPKTGIAQWTSENVWDINKSFIALKSHLPTLIKSVIYIVIVYAVIEDRSENVGIVSPCVGKIHHTK